MDFLYYCVCFFMFFSGMYAFCSLQKHLLLTLLGMEFLSMFLYFMLFFFLFYYGMSYYLILVFLTFIVCAGALGLGVLVSMIRTHGNDMVSSISVMGW